MKRACMIKGTRKSAKQIVEKFVSVAILKVEVCGAGDDPIRKQLLIYRGIAREMGWTDIVNRINRALTPPSATGIFTEGY